MKIFASLIFAFAATFAMSGCGNSGLPLGDCSKLDEASCRSSPGCAAFAPCCCGGTVVCLPAGSQPPVCNVDCAFNPACDPCKGKDEATCKTTASCVADYCTECSCTPTFVGCRSTTSAQTACPALGCAQPNCGCDGLAEQACIAAESTQGCTPFYCPNCNGGNTYQGCLAPNAGDGACPQVCSNSCRQQTDCQGGQFCLPPGQPLCGGACMIPPACNDDAFCQANGGSATSVCDVPVCECGGPMKGCIPGCTQPSDCPDGDTCSSTHHCVPIPCGQCPAHFTCDASGGHCVRQTCSSDGDCGAGACVEGGCYDTPGTCMFPVP